MKIFFYAVATVLFPLSLMAFPNSLPDGSTHLTGTLTDKSTGAAIAGAVVTIENSYAYSLSDARGNFSFDRLNEQSVTLHVQHIAYEPFTQSATLPSDDLTLQLQAKAFIADEVIVTATRAGNQSAMAYTNINKEEIEKNNFGQDIPYLLNLTPSVVTTSDAGTGIGYTGIRIRGSDATRVNVTINGIPVNDAEGHAVYWVDLPDLASSTDNIQVQRGLGTSTNGAGAFGGSVNIQSTKLNPKPHAEINSSYGSFNSWKNTVLFGSGLMDNKFSFEGRLSKITSDGYIDRATSDLSSFYMSGGYYGSKSTLKAIVFSGKEKTYQAWYGVPEDSLKTNTTYNPAGEYYDENGNVKYYDNQTDNYQQDNYQLHYSYAANTELYLNAALHYTKGNGYYEEYKTADDYSGTGMLSYYGLPDAIIGNDTITKTDLIRQLWLDNDFYGFTYSANYTGNNLQLTCGGAGNHYSGSHYDQLMWTKLTSTSAYPYIYQSNDATKDDYNAYLKAIYTVTPRLHLYGDLQYRTIQYSFLGLNDEASALRQVVKLNFFNPKGGITYDINQRNNVYASVGIGHKEPIRDDYVNQSPQLPKPEEMMDIEAGYKFTGNKFRFGFNFYYMDYKDQLILTGELNEVGAYLRQNVDKSYREGVEVELAWSLLKNLSLSANTTLSSNKINLFEQTLYDESYNPLVTIYKKSDISFSPSVISAAALAWTPVKNLSAEFSSKYVGKQYLDNTSNETRQLDAYQVNNLLLSYHLHFAGLKEIELKFAVNNVFDAKYVSNGATYPSIYEGVTYNYNYYYPQAGRNYFGGISLKF